MGWVALIAEPGVAYSTLLAPFIVAGRRHLDGDPGRAELGASGRSAMEAIGKAAGTNSMMRELGGVFGIAVVVAVFAGAGGYASARDVRRRVRAGDRRRGRPRARRRGRRPGAARPPPRGRRAGSAASAGGRAMRHVMVRYATVMPSRSSTSSCTPATCRARARSTRSCCAGGRSGSTPDAAPISRSSSGGGFSGGIVECATRRAVWLPYVEVERDRRGDRRARAGSGPRCCWSRARARRGGAASSRPRRAGRSRSGSRRPGSAA